MVKKTKHKAANKRQSTEMDSIYLLKIVLYLILGSQWLWFEQASGQRVPVPIGLLLGVWFAMHDHFQIDRKIEYAVLLVAMFVGFIANIGIFVTL